MQEIGLNITGKIPSGKLGLNYVVEAGNGRAWGTTAEAVQNNQDVNNSKSINGGLFMRPEKISGLQVGFSLRYDNLSVPGRGSETIATVHAVYVNNEYEMLNEGVYVRHVEARACLQCRRLLLAVVAEFRAFRPYFRYQYFNAPSDDPAYIYAAPNAYTPLSDTICRKTERPLSRNSV